MKLYNSGSYLNHLDDFNKTDSNFRPTETSWSGYIVFPLKQPKLRLTTKQPSLSPQDLFDKSKFSNEQLLMAPPAGLTLPNTTNATATTSTNSNTNLDDIMSSLSYATSSTNEPATPVIEISTALPTIHQSLVSTNIFWL